MSASSKKKLRKEQNAAALTEKQQKELKEAKQLKTMTLTFAVVMILVVAIVLGVAVRSPINGAINRGTHAITVGEHELSTTDLSYYYVDGINNYYNNIYSTYSSMYGDYWQLFVPFDVSKPLDEQKYSEEEDKTWAQFFMDQAFESVKDVYGLYDLAMAEGHKLTEEQQEVLDSYESTLEYYAAMGGYSSVASYLRGTYGDGANLKSFMNYYTVSAYASSYIQAYSESLEYTDEDYRAHEKGNFNNYSTFSYATYTVNMESYLPKDTTSDDKKSESTATTSASDKKKEPTAEEKAAALDAAKKDAEALASGKYETALKFDEAIKALAINKDSKTAKSSQSEDVFYANISNSDIKKWVGTTGRTPGEMTIIPITKTVTKEDKSTTLETTGYYVVYFMERDDNKTNLVDVSHILFKFEGGTKDSSGKVTYSDAEKAVAKEKADKLLAEWKAGDATLDSFKELANKNSADSDGKDGGLYEDIYPGQMVDSFNDWCFNAERKPGDTEVIETEYGYHIMYFVETNEITYRDYMIKNELVNEDTTEWHDEIAEKVEIVTVNLDRMEWDFTFN